MTAFNTLQLDEDGGEGQISRERSSEFFSSSSWDSEGSKLHICRCCCNKESREGAEEKETMNSCSKFSAVCCHHALNPEKLPESFMSKQEVLCFLNHELEQERIAAESAANEAISMILRLQVEKAALQMEARHYQELLEARALYDEETISQLKEVISSQEADRLILEREVDECKQALHMFSEHHDKERQVCLLGYEDDCKAFGRSASAPSYSWIIDGGISTPQVDQESFVATPLMKKINNISVHSVEGARQTESEFKEEAKTKHVVSISSSRPLLNGGARDIALQAHAKVDHQLGSLHLEGSKVFSKENWFDDVIRECWLGILTQLSRLQKQIRILGLSGIGAQHAVLNCQGCILNCRKDSCADTGRSPLCAACLQNVLQNVFHNKDSSSKDFSQQDLDFGEKNLPGVFNSWSVPGLKNVIEGQSHDPSKFFSEFHQQEKAANKHIHSWNEIITTIDSCLVNLEERFASYKSTLQALEVARKTMTEAAKMLNKNRGKSANALMKASNLLKEFLSFTGLGCNILDILHKLVSDLTKAANLADASCADTYLGLQSKTGTCAMVQDTTLGICEEGSPLGQGDSPSNSSSTLSKLALLWSSSLEWLSNEKCRAETAFSGWDHI